MIRFRIILPVVMLAGAVSGCGAKKEIEPPAGDPFAGGPATSQEDRLGKGFGEASRADPNSEPAKVDANSVRPVSLTEEPMDVHER
jgi:hypothetical protein